MTSIRSWASLIKLSHTVFSLPFAMVGFCLALVTYPNANVLFNLLLMLFAVFFARNAAMAFNRFTDWKIDLKNQRTALREIPAMIISPEKALLFVFLNVFLFMLSAYLINPLAFYLSPLAVVVILGYSYSKRVTWLCHYILGLGLAIAPVGAYIVIAQKIEILPLILSVAVFFWVGGFDILYALQDEEFDKKEQLHSIPQRFGRKLALIISALSHFITLVLLCAFGLWGEFSFVFWIGLGLFSVIIIWEHIVVKPSDISKVNLAFATMNATASVVFALFTIVDIFRFYFFW